MKRKVDKLDVLFSKYIRLKANYACEYCGGNGQTHCHHGVVHRRYKNTRYEEDNCACVCVSCHWYLGDFPQINTQFFRKRIGLDRMEQLEILARSGGKIDRVEISKNLKEKIKLLEVNDER